ncbi:MAG: outer membrane beta-barrel protein [Sulfuricella sp.]|nr:outer membrane beta-barrel protein [Sulfuricella sp.]
MTLRFEHRKFLLTKKGRSMKRSANVVVFLGLLAGTAADMAQAADTGFYGYLSAGQSKSARKAESDQALTGSGATAFTSSYDDTDTGYKLQAGYRINKNLAVEGGYADLGKFTYNTNVTAPLATTGVVTLKVDGWNVGVVGRLPFSETVTGFAKLGAFAYNVDYACTRTGTVCTNPTRTASGTSANYGAGVDFNFASNWFARAEYEVFTRVGDTMNATGSTGTTRADVDMASVGIGYKF